MMIDRNTSTVVAIAFFALVWGAYGWVALVSGAELESASLSDLAADFEPESEPAVLELEAPAPPPAEEPPPPPESLTPVPRRPTPPVARPYATTPPATRPPVQRPAPSPGAGEISRGEEVRLEDHLVPGKITIFDFYSMYCPPCNAIAPKLAQLQSRRDDIAVVRVNINRPGVRGIDWQSPVARQYDLHSIPSFIIYDADGRRMAEGTDARALVQGWISE